MQTKCKIYAGEHLNQSFHYKQKVKVKTEWWQSFRHLTPVIKSDESTSTYADKGIAYSRFHLFTLYFSCDPYILKKIEEMYFVLKRLFLKIGAWNKSFFLYIFIYNRSFNILIIGL